MPRFFKITTLIAEAIGEPSAISIAEHAGARFDAQAAREHRSNASHRNRRLRATYGADIGVRRTTRASSVVINGATASMISVLAVDVSVSASMKVTNMSPTCNRTSVRPTPVRRKRARKVTSQQQIAADENRGKQAAPERDLEAPSACSSGDR